ncbi:MAG: hypothetical protein QOC79_1735, partial [Actinomycetota bacterium]|nr:hypothetical protein [Actinomycetota bacterium]
FSWFANLGMAVRASVQDTVSCKAIL